MQGLGATGVETSKLKMALDRVAAALLLMIFAAVGLAVAYICDNNTDEEIGWIR